MCIMVNPIWNTTTSINRERIILLLPELRALTKFFLLCLSFGIKLAFIGNNISGDKTQTALFRSLETILRYFSIEV